MSPGFARIAVVVALVLGGVGVLASAFDSSTASSGNPSTHVSPSTSSSVSPSPSATPAPHKTGVKFVVFNGTSETGLAAQVQQLLMSKGYVVAVQATNSPVGTTARTQIYYRGGAAAAQNLSDARYLAGKYFKGAKVSELGSTFSDAARGADIAIVLGADYQPSAGG